MSNYINKNGNVTGNWLTTYDDGSTMCGNTLTEFSKKHNLVLTSVNEICDYIPFKLDLEHYLEVIKHIENTRWDSLKISVKMLLQLNSGL